MSMTSKNRKASLLSWMQLRHRMRGAARNPELVSANPQRFKADVSKLLKIVEAHMKELGW